MIAIEVVSDQEVGIPGHDKGGARNSWWQPQAIFNKIHFVRPGADDIVLTDLGHRLSESCSETPARL